MQQIAMKIANNLHFHMARMAHKLFEINIALAESGQGFAFSRFHGREQLRLIFNDAHTAPTAAPARFQHQGIADAGGDFFDLSFVVGQGAARRHNGHTRFFGDSARRYLVAKRTQDRR